MEVVVAFFSDAVSPFFGMSEERYLISIAFPFCLVFRLLNNFSRWQGDWLDKLGKKEKKIMKSIEKKAFSVLLLKV